MRSLRERQVIGFAKCDAVGDADVKSVADT